MTGWMRAPGWVRNTPWILMLDTPACLSFWILDTNSAMCHKEADRGRRKDATNDDGILRPLLHTLLSLYPNTYLPFANI